MHYVMLVGDDSPCTEKTAILLAQPVNAMFNPLNVWIPRLRFHFVYLMREWDKIYSGVWLWLSRHSICVAGTRPWQFSVITSIHSMLHHWMVGNQFKPEMESGFIFEVKIVCLVWRNLWKCNWSLTDEMSNAAWLWSRAGGWVGMQSEVAPQLAVMLTSSPWTSQLFSSKPCM